MKRAILKYIPAYIGAISTMIWMYYSLKDTGYSIAFSTVIAFTASIGVYLAIRVITKYIALKRN